MEVKSATKLSSELQPVGSRANVSSSPPSGRKKEVAKIVRRSIARVLESSDVSEDGSCSSDSSCGRRTLVKGGGLQSRKKNTGVRSVKVVPEGIDAAAVLLMFPVSKLVVQKKRCAWITPNSEPVYVSFHDEEWGVPVHDDQKLFELLVLSEALAEFSWPAILNKRDLLRKLFDNFDSSSIAQFTEKKILSVKSSGGTLLSEQKMRAVIENARQMLKVIEELGSFNNYCWSFVNHKPIINGSRYARQVPVKTPKAEAMSKDMMQRGFRCVGPTVIYSFMQAAGMVNDHLSSCFRFEECIGSHSKESRTSTESMTSGKGLTKKCSLQD
ncbi:uncharacterized protein [Elaeis guineensis]|uniref:Uncharacterized protein LOC105060960 n=1 Tax=Elaeis guineensis var. tenera TaxID=51953 RepID=A0A6I9SP49_ELAGV|nr:uncharacterized protein LOC105060960 [Elaeis guineensis]